ncbi:MAG: type 1 glutamine amidotransferase, partial [Solirubrobacterales bacterium]|nr:type 1 glutamine amidotransferase [Solirubrobacterales bacterium]
MPARTRDTLTGPRPNLLVLQHIACEPPGAYEDELHGRGGGLQTVMVDQGEPLPDWRAFDGIIAMGGPMGAYEDDQIPWLKAEKRLIAEAVSAGAPFWGVCLGSQLLAASLGASVGPGPGPEVGVLSVYRTAEGAADPVFSVMPDEFEALQWHSDTFELPEGAVQLARSDAYEQQAFVFKRAYGVQFHIEVGTALATEWGQVPAYAESLDSLMGENALPRLLAEIGTREDEMTTLARRLFAAWLEHVVPGAPSGLSDAGVQPHCRAHQLGVALSNASVGQLEDVLETDAYRVTLGDGRGQHLPSPRAVAVPKLRNRIRDTPRDRAGLVNATVDLDQSTHDLVRERAPRQFVGSVWRGQPHLDGDSGVQGGADDPRSAELGQRDRHEIRRPPPCPNGGGSRERIGIDRRGGREPDRQPGGGGVNGAHDRVAGVRRHRLDTASIARMDVDGERA